MSPKLAHMSPNLVNENQLGHFETQVDPFVQQDALQVDPIYKMKREKSVAKPPTAKPTNQFGHMRYQSVI